MSKIGGVHGGGQSGDKKLGARRNESLDSMHWVTNNCGNVENSIQHALPRDKGLAASRRKSIIGWSSTWCMLCSVYAVLGVCCTRCMLYSVYAVLGVCCTRCMLYSEYAVLNDNSSMWHRESVRNDISFCS